ncbi:MAG: ABC transporter substrate-binding protein, partial [Methanimicrococcus sp.]|nr:ABC transporter substrate-binding protein [Methanimicrococcus sp.]
IIAAVQINGSSLVIPVDAVYNGPADLVGKTVATFPPGSIQDTLLKQWLADNGIDYEKDLNLTSMDAPAAQTALLAGQIDAVFLPHPSPSIIVQSGYGKIVMDSGEMDPDHACCVLAVSQAFIDAHPDVVREIVKIHVEATKYTQEHPEEAAKYYSEATDISEDLVLVSIGEWDGHWISDPHLIEDFVVSYAKSQYDQGLVPKLLTKEDLFDTSFYDDYVNGN